MIVGYRKQKSLSIRKPYTIEVDEYGRHKRVYKELPEDDDIDRITYDPEILEMAVWDKVLHDRPTALPPDTFLEYNQDWQTQVAIFEHIMRYAGIISD